MIKISGSDIVVKPLYQAVLVFGSAVVIACLDTLISNIGIWDSAPNNPWVIMTSFVLFFALMNSVLSLRTKNIGRYWSQSITLFALVVAGSVGISYLLTGLSIDEAGSFRMVFMALTFGYLAFLSIARLLKVIVARVIREDEKMREK